MKQLSIGVDSTLGNHREIAVAVFGAESPAIKFLDQKIAESPNGANEEVLADEGQFVHLLGNIHFNAKSEEPAEPLNL